ncbi:MAG: hypothetical protein KDJ65_16375 [Anaerolineae bacterium]|nr:hypothetical protein [Anaerolineae bacterium]
MKPQLGGRKFRLIGLWSLCIVLIGVVAGCGLALPQETTEQSASVSEDVATEVEMEPVPEIVSDSDIYAANPELMAANRFVVTVNDEDLTNSEFYAANPELMAANRFVITIKDETLSNSEFYAANPELMAANRFVITIKDETLSNSEFYAANPELMAAGRYVVTIKDEAPTLKPETSTVAPMPMHERVREASLNWADYAKAAADVNGESETTRIQEEPDTSVPLPPNDLGNWYRSETTRIQEEPDTSLPLPPNDLGNWYGPF